MNRPFGVTLAAIILGISGAWQLFAGAEAMGWLSMLNLEAGGETSGATLLLSGAITLLVAIGLFTTARWAWLLTVAVMVIRIAVDIFAIVTHGFSSMLGVASITNLVISAVILWYFMRPSVRAAFNS